MRALAILAAFAAAVLACPVMAQSVVTSAAPERVSVTVYRNPNRGRGAMDLRYLGGFALVTETRRVRLPRGPATLRFEGVAEGIVPVSAIVGGLPGGTVEKNRDARLLSPASLVDGTLGREVTLLRTDRATGRRREEAATIVAGPTPGVVLRTPAGIETLRCSGLAETLRFARVPADLSAKPVLSVATATPAARTATVTLSYLASGFDWSASYVARLAPDGRTLDLFAWLTLANSNPESFVAADVQAVAGRLNRTSFRDVQRRAGALRLTCYPLGTTTSDLRLQTFEAAEEIVVTASRAMAGVPPPPEVMMMAPSAPPPPPPPEDLGDLKLYRVPERVTVAPRGQKQVALLSRAGVPFDRRYRLPIYPGQPLTAAPMRAVLEMRNVKERGLGLALPTGTTTLYADRQGSALLLATGVLPDQAEGETVRLAAGVGAQVLVAQVMPTQGESVLTVTNANPFPVTAVLPIGGAGQTIKSEELARIDGVATWTATVPPNGEATLTYRF